MNTQAQDVELTSKNRDRVLVIGSINVDIVFKTRALPLRGETLFSKSFETHFGGKGANQAFTAGKIGKERAIEVTFLGAVGEDNYGRESLENLKNNGNVNIEHIMTIPNVSTGLANIVVADNGDNTIIVNSGANFAIAEPRGDYNGSESFIARAKPIIDAHEIILFQLELPLPIVEALMIYAKSKGKCVILNPAPAPLTPLSSEALSAVDFLIPNETELAALAGAAHFKGEENLKTPTVEETITAGKAWFPHSGVNNLIITLGEAGAYFINQEEAFAIRSYPVEAVDTTCAGDSFIGTFAAELAAGSTLKTALDFASRVSAVVVTKSGAQSSIPDRQEVEAFPFRQLC